MSHIFHRKSFRGLIDIYIHIHSAKLFNWNILFSCEFRKLLFVCLFSSCDVRFSNLSGMGKGNMFLPKRSSAMSVVSSSIRSDESIWNSPDPSSLSSSTSPNSEFSSILRYFARSCSSGIFCSAVSWASSSS